MGTMEELADALARDAIRAAQELGDDDLITELSRVIGASSTTTQEAFMTAVRVRLAEQRARRLLAERLGPRYEELIGWTRAAPTPAPGPAFAEPPPVMATMAPPVMAAPLPLAAPVPAERPETGASMVAQVREAPGAVASQALDPSVDEAPPAMDEVPPAMEEAAAPEAPQEEAPQEEAPQEEAPAASDVPSAGVVRPRMAASLEKPSAAPAVTPTVTPSTDTLAAALALAASLPRKVVPPAEAKQPVPPPYPDIEIPDGDWG